MPSGKGGRDSHPEIVLPVSGAPPSSGTRAPPSSARAHADHVAHVAWGAVRDAITAIHNLEVLLKSPRVGTKVLAEVLHEFLDGVSVLRTAFAKAAETAKDDLSLAARQALAEFTRGRLDELERTMRQAMTSDFDARGRLALEQVATRVSVDIDAAAELLDVSDRAERTMETDLSLDELAKVSLRGGARGTDREIPVRLAHPDDADCLLRADPHVFKRLVAFAIARVHAAGAPEVSIRVRCGAASARIEVGPTTEAEQSLPTTVLRLVRRIEPTDAIVEAAARCAGIEMVSEGPSIALQVPRAAADVRDAPPISDS